MAGKINYILTLNTIWKPISVSIRTEEKWSIKNTVLTSQEGVYYADLKDIYFKKNVVLKDPAYNIVTDSLLYNTETQTTRFISQTTITDSSGRVIKTKEGYINQQTGIAEFGQRPEIKDGDITVMGNSITINDSTGISVAKEM